MEDEAAGDGPGAPEWHLWPECLSTWTLWVDLQTQWRTGMAWATGLDYAAVWALIDRRVPRRRRDEVFQAIQSMERAVLQVWAEKAEQERNERARR